MKKLSATIALLFIVSFSIAQNIDSIKLIETEIPIGYKQSDKRLCKTVHAESFYSQADLFASFLGSIVKKDFQSFEKKGDKGSILYFEFEKDFEGAAFLEGLLWGESGKPTRQKPDEYFAKGKLLIIWSFNADSEVKQLSKKKVESVLKG